MGDDSTSLQKPFHLALPAPDKDYDIARRQYVEQYGSALVTITYLKIALVLISLVALGLIALNVNAHVTLTRFRPLVIRIDDRGRPAAETYDGMTYSPRDADIKYFLTQFVTGFYGRAR